jgi:hypothetical protein
MDKIIGIERAEVFSPNSVARDRAIFYAVKHVLERDGFTVESCREDEYIPMADCYFSMGREKSTLDFLKKRHEDGAVVVNSPLGVEICCCRAQLNEIMTDNDIPIASDNGTDGYWLKRGDTVSQSPEDIVYAEDQYALEKAKLRFRQRGIRSMVVSAHEKGDLVKFYGVSGTGFFRYYYPGDDGINKFGDEERNGIPHHYDFESTLLISESEKLSRLIDVPVYGGDCIVNESGEFKIIDFNDWPSFSRCRADAARAIAGKIKKKLNKYVSR